MADKVVEHSEKVAIGAYDGLQFKAAKLAEDGSIDRIDLTFPGHRNPACGIQFTIESGNHSRQIRELCLPSASLPGTRIFPGSSDQFLVPRSTPWRQISRDSASQS
jgi:hypothetical protein